MRPRNGRNRSFPESGRSIGLRGGALVIVSLLVLAACQEAVKDEAAEAEPFVTSVEAQSLAPESGEILYPEIAATTDVPAPPQPALIQPEIYRGTGDFFTASAAADAQMVAEEDGITLNFANASIAEVVDTILGELLQQSYTIDPAVQGTVTIRSSRPVSEEQLYPLLETLLSANGAALVRADGLFRVVPIQSLDAALLTPNLGGDRIHLDRGFGLYFYPLRYASADKITELLEPLIPPGRSLRVDSPRNLVIFAGTSSEADDIGSMIETFDVDWLQGMSYGIYPVRFAEPDDIIVELQSIFGQDGAGPLSGLLEFLPIDRISAVLVIASVPRYLDEVEVWITRLDRGGQEAGRQIYVYRVQNGRAADLANILGSALGLPGAETTSVTESIVAPGEDAVRLGDTTSPMSDGFDTESYATTEIVESTVTPVVVGGASGDQLRITADPANNALLVSATSEEYRVILNALEQLDIEPLQVLIEATIAEVSLNDDLKYGVEWFFSSGNSSVTFSDASTGAVVPSFPGFSYLFSTNDIKVVINALAEVTNVNVISSPQLMVLNHQMARLQVGDQVPVAVQSSTSVIDPDAPIVNSIEYRDTGVILEVVPRVNAGGLVVLEITQEVSDVVETTSSTLNSPTIQQRQIESTVAIQSGETIALGGLIRDSRTEGETGVPLLMDIPLLGNLFKTTTDFNDRTELLVLLTPRVLQGAEDARAITEELRQRLSVLAPLQEKIE